MRILYVIDSLKIGGAEMLLLSLLQAYRDQHDLRVAYFTPGPLDEDVRTLGIPVHRISRGGLKDPLALPRLLRLMYEWHPDVVHTHLFKSDLLGQIAAAIAGVPARVSTLHSSNPWRKNKWFSRIMRQVVSRTHAIIAVTDEVREYTIQWSGYSADRVIVIPNGVDIHRFDLASIDPVDKVVLWAMPEDALTVGAIGRLQPAKGLHILLQAAVIVTQELPNARFVIIGDGPLRIQLEAQRGRLGLEKEVIFAGTVRDMPRALAALDVVAFSSLWEGLPVALLEAMAMALPVVATAVGGIPDVITNEQDGLLVPSNNPQPLAEGLLRLLRDADLRQRLGQRARESVQQSYSADAMHRRTLDLYTNVLARHNTAEVIQQI